WYRRTAGQSALNVTALHDGTIAWRSFPSPGFEDYNLNSQTTNWLLTDRSPVPDFHELEELPSGNLLFLSYPLKSNVDLTSIGLGPGALITDCVIQEVDAWGRLVLGWRV